MNNDQLGWEAWRAQTILHNAIMEVLKSDMTTVQCRKVIESVLSRAIEILTIIESKYP
jgi:hypothetical protein